MSTKLHSWFMNAHVNSGARLRLFCFPYAGGGASLYREWSRELPADIEVVPVQLPGRENRGLEAPLTAAAEVVDAVVREITPLLNKPYALFGHSMGALLAYETARQLSRQYGRAPRHLIVSGHGGPQLERTKKPVHALPDEEFKQELRSMNGTPEAVLQHEELMELLMPRIRADFAVCETYRHQPGPALTCPISVFGGTADPGVSTARLGAWNELTTQEFSLHMFEGDHFFLHSQHAKLLQTVQGILTKVPAVRESAAYLTV